MRLLICVISLLFLSTAAIAGDVEAGKAKFVAACESCHFEDDFSGEAEADIAAMIKGVVSGEIEHQGDASGLTDDEIAALAAYFASN